MADSGKSGHKRLGRVWRNKTWQVQHGWFRQILHDGLREKRDQFRKISDDKIGQILHNIFETVRCGRVDILRHDGLRKKRGGFNYFGTPHF